MAKNPFKSSRGVYGSDSDMLEQFLLLQNPNELKQNLDKAKQTLSTFYSKEIKSALEEQIAILKKEIKDEFSKSSSSSDLGKSVKDKAEKQAQETAEIYAKAQKSVAEQAAKEIEGDAGSSGGGTGGIKWGDIGKNIGKNLAANAINMIKQGFQQWSDNTYGKLDIMGGMGKGNSLFAQLRSEMGNLTWSQNSLRDYSKTIQSSFKQLQEDGVLVSPSTIYGMYNRLGDLVSLTGSSGARLTSLLNTVTKIQESSGVLDTSGDFSQSVVAYLGESLGGSLLQSVNAMGQIISGQNDKWTSAIENAVLNSGATRSIFLEAQGAGMSGQSLADYMRTVEEDRLQAAAFVTQKFDAITAQELMGVADKTITEALSNYAGLFNSSPELASFIASALGTNAGELLDLDSASRQRLIGNNTPAILDALMRALSGKDSQFSGDIFKGQVSAETLMALQAGYSASDSDAFRTAVEKAIDPTLEEEIYEGISNQNAMTDKLQFELENIGLQMSTDTYDNQVLGWLSVIGSTVVDFVGQSNIGDIIGGIAHGGMEMGAIKTILGGAGGSAGGGSSSILGAIAEGNMSLATPGLAGVGAAAGIGGAAIAILSVLTAWQASEKATDENIANMVGDIANPNDDKYAHKVWDPTSGKWILEYTDETNANEAQDIADVNWNNKNWFEQMGTGIMDFVASGSPYASYLEKGANGFVDMDLTYAKYAQNFREQSAADPHLQKMYSLYKVLGLIDPNKTEGEAIREFKSKYDSGELDKLYQRGKVFKFGDNWGEYDLSAMTAGGQYDDYLLARGLDNIPYDGYPAILHEGEMVIPAKRANWLRVAMGGKPVNYSNVPANRLTKTNRLVQRIPEYASGTDMVGNPADAALSYAISQIGVPYEQQDCSDLVSRGYILGAGLGVPDTTAAGIGSSWPSKGFSVLYSGGKLTKDELAAMALMPGDVLLYDLNSKPNGRFMGIDHAALVYGAGQQIHSTPKQHGTQISGLWNDVVRILRYGQGGSGLLNSDLTSAGSQLVSAVGSMASIPPSLAKLMSLKNPMVKSVLQKLGYSPVAIDLASSNASEVSVGGSNVGALASFRTNLYNSATAAEQLHMFNRTRKEVGGQGDQAIQAWLETIFNRAMSRGKTLEGVVTGNYYPSQDGLNNALKPELKSRISAALALVLGGSNITSFATGNASGNVGFGYGKGKNDPYTLMVNGERFGIEANDAKWAQQMKATALAMYEGGLIRRTPGGVNAIIGEGAYDEAVVPLRQDKDYLGIEEMSLNIVEALDIISEKICKKLDTIISLKQQSITQANNSAELSALQKSVRTNALINFRGEY